MVKFQIWSRLQLSSKLHDLNGKHYFLARVTLCIFGFGFLSLGPEDETCEDPIKTEGILFLPNESHFWWPKRDQKLTKCCTKFKRGENSGVIWLSRMGMTKWLAYTP